MQLHKLVGYIQKFLDLEKGLCYDKYVGAALGSCPFLIVAVIGIFLSKYVNSY